MNIEETFNESHEAPTPAVGSTCPPCGGTGEAFTSDHAIGCQGGACPCDSRVQECGTCFGTGKVSRLVTLECGECGGEEDAEWLIVHPEDEGRFRHPTQSCCEAHGKEWDGLTAAEYVERVAKGIPNPLTLEEQAAEWGFTQEAYRREVRQNIDHLAYHKSHPYRVKREAEIREGK